MGRQPSDLEEDRPSMLKAGLFLAFFFVLANGNQESSNAALKRYLSMGRPNSLIFMHPTRSLMDKRGQQIFMPRPNSMMNAIKGKRGQQIFLPRPNSLMNALKGKRGQQIFMPSPNSMMNAIKGKRAFLHGSPNSFNFPIWSNPQFEDVEEPEEDIEDEDLYESIEKYGKRADGNFDVFLGNRG